MVNICYRQDKSLKYAMLNKLIMGRKDSVGNVLAVEA